MAIGEDVGTNGMMTNVCRVFNDNTGVELVERTGRNPCYEYLQLGCSQRAVQRMLHYAKTQCVGKPFSNYGMARSVLWPRNTDGSSFFCAGTRCLLIRCCMAMCSHMHIAHAELVAAILKVGGLMDQSSNPGSATPELLHKMYKGRAACAANPFALREMAAHNGISLSHTVGGEPGFGSLSNEEREALLQQRAVLSPMPAVRPERLLTTSRSGGSSVSPSRSQFRVIASGAGIGAGTGSASRPLLLGAAAPSGGRGVPAGCAGTTSRPGFNLTLNSLNMNAVQRTRGY